MYGQFIHVVVLRNAAKIYNIYPKIKQLGM